MRRVLIVIIAIVVALALGVVYYALDPSGSALFPRCAFLSFTGYKCPGCGSQRAIHALLHGDVAAAFRFNAMFLVSIPWLAMCLLAETQRTRNPRLYVRLNSPLLIGLFLVMVVLWWVLRNVFGW